jgi:hypothetical protein
LSATQRNIEVKKMKISLENKEGITIFAFAKKNG